MSSKKTNPVDRIGTFQGLRKQIAYEINVFNLHRMYQDFQKSYGIFSEILQKLIYQLPEEEEPITIDNEMAELYIELYYGSPTSYGLYQLDIIERKTEGGKYKLLCRGVGETEETKAFLDPEKHNNLLMKIYKTINPIMYKLWHEIGSQVKDEGFQGITFNWKEETTAPPKPDETDLLGANIIPQFDLSYEQLLNGGEEES